MNKRKFKLVLVITGIILFGFIQLSSCTNNKPKLEDELKEQALLAFNRYEQVWDFSDFWKRGNTFDACLVFA